MTHEDFKTEYYKVSARAIQLSEKARREGLISIDDDIDSDKEKQRDILEYGLRFVVNGVPDGTVIKEILSNIILQEEDKYARLIMEIKAAAVLSIKEGENSHITACLLNSFTDIPLINDPVFKEYFEEYGY
jgi:flagellar motor component MotA